MITYIQGNLFQSPAKVLVNTVNTVGIMGKGIAKDFKRFYPEMFRKYQQLCESDHFQIGQLYFYRTVHKSVLNFPTKIHWRNPSKSEYIERGLEEFVRSYSERGIKSIAFPPLGCGNGELSWEKTVRPMMEHFLNDLPIQVFVHLYRKESSPPEHRSPKEMKRWLTSEPESLGFVEVWEDLKALLKSPREFVACGSENSFQASLTDTPTEGIVIEHRAESVLVSRESILELWQFLRTAGIISASGLTHQIDIRAAEIFSILEKLPYLKAVQLAPTEYKTDADFLHGLQLIPRVGEGKNSLFSQANFVAK